MQFVKTILTHARLAALAASSAGAAVFYVLDLPLPFMLGPMFGCLIAALAGAKLQGLGWLATAMRIVLGVAVGTAITPELLDRMPQMAFSVALIPLGRPGPPLHPADRADRLPVVSQGLRLRPCHRLFRRHARRVAGHAGVRRGGRG
jgi:hypothetical protein